MPYTMRNPLYHWTHLELSRIFGIHKVLNPASAEEIYATCTDKLRTPEYRAQAIMKRMNVEVVCTTDDPIDSLEFHQKIRSSGCHIRVYPAWRPDKVLAIDNFKALNDYLSKLEAAADKTILTYKHLLEHYKSGMISSPPKGAGYRTTGWILLCRTLYRAGD